MLNQLIEAIKKNGPLEEILRQRLSLKDEDIKLLHQENAILSERLKLSFGVISENHPEITTKNSSNNNLQTFNNPTSARIDQTQSDLSIRVESVAYTEAGISITNKTFSYIL
jgi:hypothetical protein